MGAIELRTWDLFRYPGVRSDSDMFTLGYSFRPWTDPKTLADGESIRQYVRDTAREYGVDQKIRFGHRVIRADWSSERANWTVRAERTDTGEIVLLRCSFLFHQLRLLPLRPGLHAGVRRGGGFHRSAGASAAPGPVLTLDYAGKRVVVIGSGATAVTLVPAMAETAAHVTMLQRSPTYIVVLPSTDVIAKKLQGVLPSALAYPAAALEERAHAHAELSTQQTMRPH